MFKFLPRVFQKKDRAASGNKQSAAEVTGKQASTKSFNCRVVFLDETELTLNVKVGCKFCLFWCAMFRLYVASVRGNVEIALCCD
jgi:hypothetical protein